MKVKNKNSTLTKTEFNSFGFNQRLLKHIKEKMGLKFTTKIQKSSFKALLSENDALIRSETGSGKTLSYALPLVNDLSTSFTKRSEGTKALILAPTRELSLQIFTVLKEVLSAFNWLVAGTLMGGEKKKSEKARLRKGVTVLVATPGRLLDHLRNTESFDVSNVSWLVLDEADRLLDLGFEETLKEIIMFLNKKQKSQKRHNVLVSATLSKSIKKISNYTLVNPVFIKSEPENEMNKPNENFEIENFKIPDKIEQFYTVIDPSKRLIALIAIITDFIDSHPKGKVIIFVATCDEVDFLSLIFNEIENFLQLITRKKFGFYALHGDMSQKDRTSTYFKFHKSENASLVCTDIAARGLDLPAVNLIVQYDPPINPVEYIHRIGRTARLDSKGKAVLFTMPNEIDYLKSLQRENSKICEIKYGTIMAKFGNVLSKKQKKSSIKKSNEEEFLMTRIYSITASNPDIMKKARDAFDKFIKSYAAFPRELKHIFHPKNLNLKNLSKSFGLRPSYLKLKKKKISKNMNTDEFKPVNKADGKRRIKSISLDGVNKKFDYAKMTKTQNSFNLSEFAA